ncbi:hypothetical protein [Paraburkholderia nemoris]|uniref:hypothetical protein n=1 Tax=Paraburkholderia nemoris TaxID=2793076 RepID=UPI001B2DAB7D|nr:hypothetical protein [Paraburkholderia nemoris]CAE6838065.1 hypothetical protein R75777_06930 [Paraburkholderia nemoris]
MAIGDQSDFFSRLKAQIPASWFKSSPNFDATLQGPAWAMSSIYAQITYAALQTRIKTATDGYLDLISNDFFGTQLPRLTNEQDGPFRARILANLFVKGPTRANMSAVLKLITGRTPDIFEPSNTTDSGGWDGAFYWDTGVGKWGAPMPYQSFVTAYRPITNAQSLGELDSWRWSFDSYGAWSDAPVTSVTDAAIIAAVESTRMTGTVVWLRIANNPITP